MDKLRVSDKLTDISVAAERLRVLIDDVLTGYFQEEENGSYFQYIAQTKQEIAVIMCDNLKKEIDDLLDRLEGEGND